MKKIFFLPMAFAIIFLAFHAREATAEQDTSFTAFLQLFPKKNLPFNVSLKQMVKTIKNRHEIYQDSAERRNIGQPKVEKSMLNTNSVH